MASRFEPNWSKPMKKIFFPNFFYPIQFNMTNNEIMEGFKIIGIDFTKLWAFSPIPYPESCILKTANKYFRFGQRVLLEIWYACNST